MPTTLSKAALKRIAGIAVQCAVPREAINDSTCCRICLRVGVLSFSSTAAAGHLPHKDSLHSFSVCDIWCVILHYKG